MNNTADPYEVIRSTRNGPPPIVVNILTTPQRMEFTEGVPASATKMESYVLYSVLPDELKERVRTAIQAISSSI